MYAEPADSWIPSANLQELLGDINFDDPDVVFPSREIARNVTLHAYKAYTEINQYGKDYLDYAGHILKIIYLDGNVYVIDGFA